MSQSPTNKPKRINFSKANIERLPLPNEGRRYVYDVKTPGLAICLTAAGGRVFYHYKKYDGKPERIRIGEWPRVNVAMARDKAETYNGRIAEGQNPGDKRRVSRNAPTIGQVFDEFIEQPTRGKSKRPRSPKTIHDYKLQFKAHLEAWRDRQLSKLKRADVEKLHATIGEKNGKYLANRVLALLKAVLNFAVEQEYYPLNVATRIRGFDEESRDRFLTADEMPKFWKAVDAEKAADYFRLSLFTGARQANVLEMRWDQVNLDAGLWLIPKTKGGKPHSVPLSEPALQILRRRKLAGGEWVFPCPDSTGSMAAPRHGWTRILKAAGIDGLRMHDLRRSLASWQASTGTSETVIGKTLGHASIQATKVYAHADMGAVRASVDAATAAILAAAKINDAKGGGA